MKNLKILFLIAFSFILANTAFALDCKNGNGAGGSDECWTYVTVDPLNTGGPVVRGTVLEYSFASGSSEASGYLVTPSNASADWAHIAGVAQRNIATGDSGLILVRGRGKIQAKSSDSFTSGDALYVATTRDAGSIIGPTGDKAIAFAQVTQTASGNTVTTVDAFITVI